MAWLLYTTYWKIPSYCILRSLQFDAAPLCVSLSKVAASPLHRSFSYVKQTHGTDALCVICNSVQAKFKGAHPDFGFENQLSISECFTSA